MLLPKSQPQRLPRPRDSDYKDSTAPATLHARKQHTHAGPTLYRDALKAEAGKRLGAPWLSCELRSGSAAVPVGPAAAAHARCPQRPNLETGAAASRAVGSGADGPTAAGVLTAASQKLRQLRSGPRS